MTLLSLKKKTKQLILGKHKGITGHLPKLEECSFSKYFSVIIIDDSLAWIHHEDTLRKKLNSDPYVIHRMKHISDTATAKTAYHAVCECHLRYGILVRGSTTLGNRQNVQTSKGSHLNTTCKTYRPETHAASFWRVINSHSHQVVHFYILETVTHIHIIFPELSQLTCYFITTTTDTPQTTASMYITLYLQRIKQPMYEQSCGTPFQKSKKDWATTVWMSVYALATRKSCLLPQRIFWDERRCIVLLI